MFSSVNECKCERTGYKRCFVPLAKDFFQSQRLSGAEEDRGDRSQQRNLQTDLLSCFQTPAVDTTERSQAGLCLRCYVSEPILNACRKIDHLFGDDQSFTYRDLLPFVLNDDGKTLMVLDSDGKNYLTLGIRWCVTLLTHPTKAAIALD